MKKVLICFLMCFVLLGFAVAQDEPERLWWLGKDATTNNLRENGYVCGYGKSPESVKSKNVARRLAEENFQSLAINWFSKQLEERLYPLLDIVDEDNADYSCLAFYVNAIVDFSKNPVFYNFDFLDGYDYVLGGSTMYDDVVVKEEYTVRTCGFFSAIDTYLLLKNAVEIKYDYAYGKPVLDVVKELIDSRLLKWLRGIEE